MPDRVRDDWAPVEAGATEPDAQASVASGDDTRPEQAPHFMHTQDVIEDALCGAGYQDLPDLADIVFLAAQAARAALGVCETCGDGQPGTYPSDPAADGYAGPEECSACDGTGWVRTLVEAGAPAEPGYQRIADAIEAACDAAALALTARRDGLPVEEPYLRLARVLDKAGLIDWREFAGAPAEPTSDTAECRECGHPRTDHPDDQACRAVLRPDWAPDDECWCGRYVAALAGAADTAREDQS